MNYVIVIPDGCADEPVAELGNLTPLQAAKLPNMDRVAKAGVVGLSNNVPPSLTPASDVATLSLFGYDPLKVYTGRAPLETAAMGIHLGPHDYAIRCTLVYVPDGHMRHFTAGHISSEDGAPLIKALQHELDGQEIAGGVGVLLGWHRIDVPGATGYLDTNYANKGRFGVEALGAFDLVCVHVEAPDEASHEGRADEKVTALERIDEHIVGPLLAALPRYR